jgi:hypothetical protein
MIRNEKEMNELVEFNHQKLKKGIESKLDYESIFD